MHRYLAVDIGPIHIGNPITSLGKSAAQSALGVLWDAVGHAMAEVTQALWHFVAGTTDVAFTSGAWTSANVAAIWKVMLEVAAVVMLALVIASVFGSIRRQDPAGAARTLFVEVPLSIFGMAALVAVTAGLVGATDEVSGAILRTVPGSAVDTVANRWPLIVPNLELLGGLGGVVFIIGAFLVWLELLVRASLIYLVVMMAPLFLAARVLPGLAPAWKKYAETAAAIIFSKVVIAVALALGLALVAGGGTTTGSAHDTGVQIGQLLSGIALMGLAAFAPFVLLRFAPVVEAALIAQGISRMPGRAAMHGAQMTYYGAGLTRLAGAGGVAAGAAGRGFGGGAGPAESNGPPGGAPRQPAGPNGPRGGTSGATSPGRDATDVSPTDPGTRTRRSPRSPEAARVPTKPPSRDEAGAATTRPSKPKPAAARHAETSDGGRADLPKDTT